MKAYLALPALLTGFVFVSSLRAEAGGSCCATAADSEKPLPVADAEATRPAGHPLRGVILDLIPGKQALLVKHEEIPGVMRAMTMLLKVDAATLAAAKKGQQITATLLRGDDGWRLENVKPVEAPETP